MRAACAPSSAVTCERHRFPIGLNRHTLLPQTRPWTLHTQPTAAHISGRHQTSIRTVLVLIEELKKKKKRQGPSLSSQKQTPSVPCMLAAGHPGSQQQDRSWGKFGKGLESRPVFLSFSSGTVRSLACREELVHRVGSDAGSRAPPFAHATSYLLGLSAHPVPCSHLRTRRCLRCETAPGSGLLHFSP